MKCAVRHNRRKQEDWLGNPRTEGCPNSVGASNSSPPNSNAFKNLFETKREDRRSRKGKVSDKRNSLGKKQLMKCFESKLESTERAKGNNDQPKATQRDLDYCSCKNIENILKFLL